MGTFTPKEAPSLLGAPTAELTCPRRICRTATLNRLTNECKKAAIQRSAEGAGQVQRVLARFLLFSCLAPGLWNPFVEPPLPELEELASVTALFRGHLSKGVGRID
jgi:hypothetical protein